MDSFKDWFKFKSNDGKRAKEELDKGDIIFPINDGEILGAQRVDKAYVLL